MLHESETPAMRHGLQDLSSMVCRSWRDTLHLKHHTATFSQSETGTFMSQ